MNDIPRQKLREIIVCYGTTICEEPQRCTGLIKDLCGEHKREVNVLILALRERVPADLLSSLDTLPHQLLLSRLAQRLQDDHALSAEAAQWAVESWAIALGKIYPTDLAALETPIEASTREASRIPTAPVSAPQIFGPRTPERDVSGPLGVKINPIDGAEMLFIAAGEFIMGGNEDSDEQPVRRVDLDAYWIYKMPVTVSMYRKFCQQTGRQMPPGPSWGWKDNHPIVNVTWYDAGVYCEWARVSPPTEAQREKAARGTDGRTYPWGNDWDSGMCANSVASTKLSSTVAVGNFPLGGSPYGVQDVAGNVWEWCTDWYDENYYRRAPARNPNGPASSPGNYRALRGGSWISIDPVNFRAAYRGRGGPAARDVFTGFRGACGL